MVKLGINKPVTTLMLVFAIVLFSVVGFGRVPVELYPNYQLGEVSVITRLRGGIASTEVEKYVTRRLEEVFSEINGLREMLSASRESESVIVLKFYHGVDTDLIILDIREKLATIRHLLPKEAEKPIIAKFQQFDVPVLILSMSSDRYTPEQMREMAENKVKEQLMRIAGVANVEIGGGRERKFLIEIDNSKLIAYNLPILQVIEKINLANISVSAGDITQYKSKYVVRATGEYEDIEEIKDTGISITEAGSIIRIRDIADVKDSYFEPTSFARLNVQSVVSLYIQKESSANTIKVCKEVQDKINNFEKILPEGITTTVVKNDAEFIQKAIASLRTSLVYGAFLVSLILFIFLRNTRSIIIIITTIPLSLCMAVLMVYSSGLTFNVMTLSGLALGVGMLMDNAIVILENISHHYSKKTFPDIKTLIIEGTQELMMPIIASTLTTIIVFLPLVFVDPEIRQLYLPFALTITFSLIASLVSTLIFLPPLCLRWQTKYSMTVLSWYKLIEKKYSHLLALSFRYAKYIGLVTLILLLGSGYILSKKDSEFIDPGDANTFRVGVQFPPATRIERSNEIVKKMEQALLEYPKVERVSSKIEKLHTFVEVKVKSNPDEVKEEFRKKFNEFSPAFIYFQESQTAASKEVFVDLYGYDYDVLKQVAFAASGRLSQLKELSDLKIRMREDEPEVHLFVDYDKLAQFGLTTLYLGNTLHAHLRGLIATQYRTEGKEIETICRLVPGTIKSIKMLPYHSLISMTGDTIRLGQIGEIKQTKATQEIWRKNKKRFIQLSANRQKVGLTKAVEKMKGVLASISFPKDYTFAFSGDYEKTVRNKEQFSIALVLTIILIYLVLASLFESYTQPALIMFSLPLSVIGVAFFLWILKKPISLGVWIGFMILFGIVVNSSIMLVEKINLRREGHTNIIKVVFLACQERLRSILMTSLTTTLGLLPLVLSRDEAAEMWRSLGLTIIGGMLSGTILTLFLIPIAFFALERGIELLNSFLITSRELIKLYIINIVWNIKRI
ncbi:MAG: efflux RND transporter permease subunit [Endomicrobiales bacterium]|nr:efflux RND transporter permease subunit [Endomicrobiales bacterium]